MRPVLLVGGAPRLPIDAIRSLVVGASGRTAVRLAERLAERGVPAELLLAADAAPACEARRFATREELDDALRDWVAAHGEGVVVLSAAINDYRVHSVERWHRGRGEPVARGDKIASGADEVVIRLRPAPKTVDRLRGWGHRGPLVAFKFSPSERVIDDARALRGRTGAALVVANSLDHAVQALVGDEDWTAPDREALLAELAGRVAALARS